MSIGAKKYDESAQSYDTWVEYVYCPSCGGAMTERIEYSDAGTTVSSWLRYQYEGLNLLRIDERYDGSDAGTAINEGDPWRPVNVFVHAPGQIGQIAKCSIYDGGWVDDVYYHYDALGNVMGYTDSNANATTFEMDAFGQAVPAPMVSVTCFNCDRVENRTIGALNDYGFKENINSSYWESMTSIGPKEHLTGKMLDDDTGLYYFHAHWYDPQVGRFIGRDPVFASFEDYDYCGSSPLIYVDPTGLLKFNKGAANVDFNLKEIFFSRAAPFLRKDGIPGKKHEDVHRACLWKCTGVLDNSKITKANGDIISEDIGGGKIKVTATVNLELADAPWFSLCVPAKPNDGNLGDPGIFYAGDVVVSRGLAHASGTTTTVTIGGIEIAESYKDFGTSYWTAGYFAPTCNVNNDCSGPAGWK